MSIKHNESLLARTAGDMQRDMQWLATVIDARMKSHFGAEHEPFVCPAAPPLERGTSDYADLVLSIAPMVEARVILALALAPHLVPHDLDVFLLRNQSTDRGFTEFGGLKGIQHAGFLPTGETALFVLGGTDVEARLRLLSAFDAERPLLSSGVVTLGVPAQGEPAWSGALSFSPSVLRMLATGEPAEPDQGAHFPARRVKTKLTWDDLVIAPEARAEVETIVSWARHRSKVLTEWGLGRHVSRGFSALFYGPPGTGKTMTAGLLGRELGVETYRIDLSQMVSKYIGETEKNLARVFDEAARKEWILFFDEADALFGKRTNTTSSHDRYANQEVSYLLQRVEEHPGLVILATNFRGNIDEAFSRRFHTVVHFALPDARQRERIWQSVVGQQLPLASDVVLRDLARAYELSGAQIVNVVRHAALAAVSRGDSALLRSDIDHAVRREQRKEGQSTAH